MAISNLVYSILKIVIYILVFLILYGLVFGNWITEYINLNWGNLRCFPLVMPFAGLSTRVRGDNIVDRTKNNFEDCTNGMLMGFLGKLLEPVMGVLNGIFNGLTSIKEILNSFKKTMTGLKEIFLKSIGQIQEKLEKSMLASIYLQEKIKIMLKKQNAMFMVMKQYVTLMPLLFYSFTHGPIPRFANWLMAYSGVCIALIITCLSCVFGGPFVAAWACPICLLCFEENTMIELENGKEKKIKDLEVNEKIKGGIILGKIEIEKNIYELYKLNNTLVTGDHLVFHRGKWMRVENVSNIEKIHKSTKLYCLITSNYLIYSNGVKYRDYKEIGDRDINQIINYRIAMAVNNNDFYITNKNDIKHQYYWGFGGNTIIKIGNRLEKIGKIVEERIKEGSILGYVKLKNEGIQMYNLNGIKVSGTTLYKDVNYWERVYQSDGAKEYSNNEDEYIYNILTSNNIIEVQNENGNILLFRDFSECSDKEVNSKIDKIVENRLNLMLY